MNVTFYSNFTKKKNSTKQPSGGTTLNCLMKKDCSISAPVFLIDGIDLSYNYCYFNGRYYFITDIVLNKNNIYEINCRVDVLATYKLQIGNYTAFVERAGSRFDDKINDVFLSSQQFITNAGVATTDVGMINGGCYIFRTVSGDGINSYATEDMEMLGAIYQNSTYGTSDTIIQSILDSIGMSALDASQYLLNVMWVPFDISSLSGTAVNGQDPSPTSGGIELGFWRYKWPAETGWAAKKLTEFRKGTTQTLVMPHSAYNDFRAYSSEFTRYTIFLPGVGTVNLNALDTKFELGITMECDLISGGIGYIIRNTGGGNYIATFNGQLGVNIPMVSTNINSAGFLESVAGTIAAVAASETGVGVAAALAAGTVNSVKTLASEQGSINGYNGNIGMIKRSHQVLVNIEQYGSKDFPLVVAGRPLYENTVINTLSGFVKCGGASLDIGGFENEKSEVNTYLNSGFYYE